MLTQNAFVFSSNLFSSKKRRNNIFVSDFYIQEMQKLSNLCVSIVEEFFGGVANPANPGVFWDSGADLVAVVHGTVNCRRNRNVTRLLPVAAGSNEILHVHELVTHL